jgi:hypothetical protein
LMSNSPRRRCECSGVCPKWVDVYWVEESCSIVATQGHMVDPSYSSHVVFPCLKHAELTYFLGKFWYNMNMRMI